MNNEKNDTKLHGALLGTGKEGQRVQDEEELKLTRPSTRWGSELFDDVAPGSDDAIAAAYAAEDTQPGDSFPDYEPPAAPAATEDEEDYSELEKEVAAKYGVDLEGHPLDVSKF
jgi:hypothetical protein